MPEVVQSAQVVAATAETTGVVVVVHAGSHSPQVEEVVVVVVVVHGSHSPVAETTGVVVVVVHAGSQSVQVEAVVVVVVVVVHAGSHSSQVPVVVFDGQSVTSGPQEVMVTSTEAATAATRPETMTAERILIDLFCSKKIERYVGSEGLVLETNVSEL